MFAEDEYPSIIKKSTKELELLDKEWRKKYEELKKENQELKNIIQIQEDSIKYANTMMHKLKLVISHSNLDQNKVKEFLLKY